MVTKEQLTNAIADFILEDIANDIRDASVKAMAIALAKMLKKNPNIIDKVMDNNFVSAMISKNGDEYDLSTIIEVISETVQEQGKICLSIPSIPIIHPTETVLGVTFLDLQKLIGRLN